MRPADLAVTTDRVNVDEECWGVQDVDLITDDYKAQHRFRLTYVRRNNKIAAYVQDLNELGWYSSLLPRPVAQVVCAGTDRVGEVWEQIEKEVYGREDVVQRIAELQAESTLLDDAMRDAEIVKEYKRRNPRTTGA